MLGMCKFLVVIGLQQSYFSAGEYLSRSCPDEGTVNNALDEKTYQVIEDYVRLGHYIELRCCASNFSKIRWYKQVGSSWTTFVPFSPEFNPIAPTLMEDGQVLVVKSATKSDEGIYKCVIEKDGTEMDKRKIILTVAECDALARGPYPIAPLPCEKTSVSLGSTVMLPCTGYFGCGDDKLRTVTWLVTDINGAPSWRPVSEVSDRYEMKDFQRNGDSELGSNLTITNIEPIDLDRKFMCLLSTPQVIHGESKVMVQLIHRQQGDKDLKADSASMALVPIIGVLAVLVIVLTLYSVVITIRYRRYNTWKTRQPPSNPEQDVMIRLPIAAENI